MRQRDGLADGQPQSAAALLARTRSVAAVKRLEQMAQLRIGNAGRTVFHDHDDPGMRLLQADQHLTGRIGVAQAVFHQVGQQLLNATGVPVHGQRRQRVRQLQVQPQAGGAGPAFETLHHPAEQVRRIGRLKVAGQHLQVGGREQVQVIDQLADAQHFLVQHADGFATQRPNAVLQRLDVAAQHGQRCAQFVRDVGQPAPACAFQSLQAFGHAVDVAHHVTDLIAPTRQIRPGRQAHRQFTLGQALGGVLHGGQRTGPAARQQRGGEQGQRDQARRTGRDDAVLVMQKARLAAFWHQRRRPHANHGHHLAVQAHRAFDQRTRTAVARRQRPTCQHPAVQSHDLHALPEPVRPGRWTTCGRMGRAKQARWLQFVQQFAQV